MTRLTSNNKLQTPLQRDVSKKRIQRPRSEFLKLTIGRAKFPSYVRRPEIIQCWRDALPRFVYLCSAQLSRAKLHTIAQLILENSRGWVPNPFSIWIVIHRGVSIAPGDLSTPHFRLVRRCTNWFWFTRLHRHARGNAGISIVHVHSQQSDSQHAVSAGCVCRLRRVYARTSHYEGESIVSSMTNLPSRF